MRKFSSSLTTFHPSDHSLRNLVRNNWDILGQSVQTANLHKKCLMIGYRRPKNLRDVFVHASIPRLEGDETVDPNHVEPPRVEAVGYATAATRINNQTTQMSKRGFLTDISGLALEPTPTVSGANTNLTISAKVRYKGTNPANRGFTFCKHTICRFCPQINLSGRITSHSTGLEYDCMKKVSCRSFNVIYCVSCTRL